MLIVFVLLPFRRKVVADKPIISLLQLLCFGCRYKSMIEQFEKNRGCRPRCCGQPVNLHTSYHSHHRLGGYSKLTNGLIAAASGTLYADVRAYCSHVKCIVRGHVCCPLIHDSSFFIHSFILPMISMLFQTNW